MSSEEIKKFNAWLINNDEAKAKVEAYGSDLEKIVAFARASGFDIDLDYVKKVTSEDVELDIDSLETVSGGTREGVFGLVAVFIINEY
jgi:predicted ribosomally synthesized peptide with nif11-like leader